MVISDTSSDRDSEPEQDRREIPPPVVIVQHSSGEDEVPVGSAEPVETVIEAAPRRYDDAGLEQDPLGNPDEAGWVFYDASTKSFVASNGYDETERGEAS